MSVCVRVWRGVQNGCVNTAHEVILHTLFSITSSELQWREEEEGWQNKMQGVSDLQTF